jgi:hypothetical protein
VNQSRYDNHYENVKKYGKGDLIMISAETMIYYLGAFFILAAVYLVAVLIFRKRIWNYPVIVSIYIIFALYFLSFGIILIKQMKITRTMETLMFVVIVIWSCITYFLPARKEEMTKSSISIYDIIEKNR